MIKRVKNTGFFFCSHDSNSTKCTKMSNCEIKCNCKECNPDRIVNITIKRNCK